MRYYTNEHSFVDVDDNNRIVIGVTEFGVSELNGITFCEINGKSEKKGSAFAFLESQKSCVELHLPFDCEFSHSFVKSDGTPLDKEGDIRLAEYIGNAVTEGLMTKEQYDGYCKECK